MMFVIKFDVDVIFIQGVVQNFYRLNNLRLKKSCARIKDKTYICVVIWGVRFICVDNVLTINTMLPLSARCDHVKMELLGTKEECKSSSNVKQVLSKPCYTHPWVVMMSLHINIKISEVDNIVTERLIDKPSVDGMSNESRPMGIKLSLCLTTRSSYVGLYDKYLVILPCQDIPMQFYSEEFCQLMVIKIKGNQWCMCTFLSSYFIHMFHSYLDMIWTCLSPVTPS